MKARSYSGKDLLKLSDGEMRSIRGNTITMVFQDPTTFLNPVMTIGEQVSETLLVHRDLRRDLLEERVTELSEKLEKAKSSSQDAEALKVELEGLKKMEPAKFHASRRDLKKVAKRRSIELLRTVRLPEPEAVVKQYPHELSGGMRQRVIISMAIACHPELLIADEPTTALDVTIQAQILDLLSDLKQTIGLTSMFITHDLGVVAESCDRVAVMYAGNIVEVADTERLFEKPLHPYTQAMLRAIPKVTERKTELESIKGSVPNLIEPPRGCRFHPRCPFVMDNCRKLKPELVEVERGHSVACFLHTEKEH